MNTMQVIAEARASALSLRASARACGSEQGSLKFRLMRTAESLDGMVLLAVRGLERIEQLEQQLAATAGRGEPAARAAMGSHSAGSSAMPDDMPISPVIVGGVDVAPSALAAALPGYCAWSRKKWMRARANSGRRCKQFAGSFGRCTPTSTRQAPGVRHEWPRQGAGATTTRRTRFAGAGT